jgi:hypothetical protein
MDGYLRAGYKVQQES